MNLLPPPDIGPANVHAKVGDDSGRFSFHVEGVEVFSVARPPPQHVQSVGYYVADLLDVYLSDLEGSNGSVVEWRNSLLSALARAWR